MKPQITLEQWQALLAVVDAGGYAQAAEALGKSQSAVSYAIQKLETVLGVRVFALSGRKASLTETGQALYCRAQSLVAEASMMEQLASQYASGWEAEVRIAVDTIFPEWLLLETIDRFGREAPHTRIELRETVLSGTDEALLGREVEIALCARVPPGFLGDHLMRIRFLAVAHPDHPLHQLDRPLSFQDLRLHRQLVVRDSGSRRLDAGWLGAQQRLTLSQLRTSIDAACRGMGFAWYPEEKIRQPLQQGTLKALPLSEGTERFADIYLVYSRGDYSGPASRRLGELLKAQVEARCPNC